MAELCFSDSTRTGRFSEADHFKGKTVFLGKLADMPVIMKAFQTVKESLRLPEHLQRRI